MPWSTNFEDLGDVHLSGLSLIRVVVSKDATGSAVDCNVRFYAINIKIREKEIERSRFPRSLRND